MPYLLGRFVLDVVPLGLFALVGHALLGTELGAPPVTRLVIVAVVEAYVLARLILLLTALLVSPASPRLRLLRVSDWAAAFLTRWVRRVAIVAIVGYGLAQVGLLFGMYRTAYEALLKLFALVVHLCLVVAVLQARVPVARRMHARHGARGAGAMLLNRWSEIWHLVAIFYIMALWLVWAVELQNGYVRLVRFFLVTGAVFVGSRLLAIVVLGGFDRFRIGPDTAARHPGLEARLNAYYPILRTALMAVIGITTLFGLLEAWGFGVIGWFEYTGLGGRALSAVTLIGFTVVLAVLVWEGTNAAIEVHMTRLREMGQLARAGRLRTLLPMLRTMLMVTILLIVALTILSELGVNIAPLLAGAGVVGIAVGFGSQKLVQDLITGLFLLLENAMQVGDVVTLGGLTGTVEALSIRAIRLRAVDGAVHIIPFSAVTTVTNQTRDYGFAVLDVSVGLNEEPDPVRAVLVSVAEEMRADPKWSSIPAGTAGGDGGGQVRGHGVDHAHPDQDPARQPLGGRAGAEPADQEPLRRAGDRKPVHEPPRAEHQPAATRRDRPGPAHSGPRSPARQPGMTDWTAALRDAGFIFVRGAEMQRALEAAGLAEWDTFARSWDDLGLDTYMADGGRYRKRRHAAFRAAAEGVVRKPHQPHYQSRDYNALNGGIARWFDPVLPEVAAGPAFQSILRVCHGLFDGLTPAATWHVEAHQFRIEARPGQAGQPTPEGMHQDGVDWVLVFMVGRRNIASGTTSIHGLDRGLLGSFTLEAPMDSALVDDHRVFHGVTAVQPLDPAQPGVPRRAGAHVSARVGRQPTAPTAVCGWSAADAGSVAGSGALRSGALRSGALSSGVMRRGRVMTASSPGAADCRTMVPPCRWATARTRVRPRPKPGVWRAVSPRKKRSVARATSSAGMPAPSSATTRRIASGPPVPSRRTTPPAGENFSALSSRLAIACWISSRSPRVGSVGSSFSTRLSPRSSATAV